jgi:thioredoxin reductase (NADPH)
LRKNMSVTVQFIAETRREQVFPVLDAVEIQRLRRFGQLRSYEPGEVLVRIGDVGVGLMVVLAGRVEVSQPDGTARGRYGGFEL